MGLVANLLLPLDEGSRVLVVGQKVSLAVDYSVCSCHSVSALNAVAISSQTSDCSSIHMVHSAAQKGTPPYQASHKTICANTFQASSKFVMSCDYELFTSCSQAVVRFFTASAVLALLQSLLQLGLLAQH